MHVYNNLRKRVTLQWDFKIDSSSDAVAEGLSMSRHLRSGWAGTTEWSWSGRGAVAEGLLMSRHVTGWAGTIEQSVHSAVTYRLWDTAVDHEGALPTTRCSLYCSLRPPRLCCSRMLSLQHWRLRVYYGCCYPTLYSAANHRGPYRTWNAAVDREGALSTTLSGSRRHLVRRNIVSS